MGKNLGLVLGGALVAVALVAILNRVAIGRKILTGAP